MKSIRMTIRIAAMMVIVAMGCKEDDSVPNQEIEDLLRAHVWLEDYTKIDGVFSELYEGMTLAFGSTTYDDQRKELMEVFRYLGVQGQESQNDNSG